MTGFALHMGNQAETTVILEFVGVVQTCFHRHFLTRLPQKGANFFLIQPLASRAERTPAWQGQKGGHSTHRQKHPQIKRRLTVHSCRIYERFKEITCASQNIFDVDCHKAQTPQGTRLEKPHAQAGMLGVKHGDLGKVAGASTSGCQFLLDAGDSARPRFTSLNLRWQALDSGGGRGMA